MSIRAEAEALKAYPVVCEEHTERDINKSRRLYYIKGYKQAEKDLALTTDDVWCIFNLVRDLQTKYSAIEGCLQEVADIFNEQRRSSSI